MLKCFLYICSAYLSISLCPTTSCPWRSKAQSKPPIPLNKLKIFICFLFIVPCYLCTLVPPHLSTLCRCNHTPVSILYHRPYIGT
uniref:DNA methylase n=1 Tax=uncultured marine virus TaxID=186617 RepID=A0A0F7L1C0_9VIRU|nr:DNA methylase [uncultured marine virus]